MTQEQEIKRIRKEYSEHWQNLEGIPAIQKALADNDPIRLGEEAAKIVRGDTFIPTKQELDENEYLHPYYQKREIVSVNKLEDGWPDKAYLAFRQGNHVNLENFVHPDDVEWCQRVAKVLERVLKMPCSY